MFGNLTKVKIKDKDKIVRKMTFHLYKDKMHTQTQVSGIYKFNPKTGKEAIDPFKWCKTLRDVREVFLTTEKPFIAKVFDEDTDFMLAKINKRGLSTFQQIFPKDLNILVKQDS